MSRPTNNPDPEDAEKDRQAMMKIRLSVGLAHCQFGQLIGMPYFNLRNRERGKCAWRKDELRAAKSALKDHFNKCAELVRTTL